MAGGVGMAQVPEKPAQQAPIVDLAGIINNDSLVAALNAQLDSLSKKTQNQIVVVTVKDMGGLDPKEFATTLGQQWGIGGKALNNGFVIAVKPKDENGSGKIGFATGYGLEGVLPDVFCKRLQTEYMVPHFKEGDYAAGIKAAIDEIVPVVLNEYNEAQALAGDTKKKEGGTGNGWFIIAGTSPRNPRRIPTTSPKTPSHQLLRNPPTSMATEAATLAAVEQAPSFELYLIRIKTYE